MTIKIKPENRGKFHKDTDTPMGKKIPLSKIKKAEKSEDPAIRKRAVFAENSRKWNYE